MPICCGGSGMGGLEMGSRSAALPLLLAVRGIPIEDPYGPRREFGLHSVGEAVELGHSAVALTLRGYSHARPAMHRNAAESVAYPIERPMRIQMSFPAAGYLYGAHA